MELFGILSIIIMPAYRSNAVITTYLPLPEYIAHKLFKSVTELKKLLEKLLNQGELIIKWGRKIKNKGNAAVAI